MPVRNIKQIKKMMLMARVTVPKNFIEKLEKFPNDAKQIGTEFAIKQCQDLIENGITSLHFFTLNHSDQTCKILDNVL